MFHDENYPPIDFSSLPRIHIKRSFNRQTPITFDDLNRLVRVVKPLSERFRACLKEPYQWVGPATAHNDQSLYKPSLSVTIAVANDEVCRVQVAEDWGQVSDVWHNEKLDIGRTMAVDRQLVGKLRNVMIGGESRCHESDSRNVVGRHEFTSIETTSDMSLCSDDDTSITVVPQKVCSWQASSGSVLESGDMEKLGKNRSEKNAFNTLEGALVDQLSSEAEYSALMTTRRENHNLKDLSTYHHNVSWQLPAISEAIFQDFDSMEHMAVDNYKKRKFSEFPDRDNRNKNLNNLVELEGRLKTKHGKDKSVPRSRSDHKQQIEVEDEDILNEGRMELEKALFKRRADDDTDERQHRKLENAHLFHGRTILVSKCEPPWLIPLEDVSNEIHYKWKDGQLVSYMKDPRLERGVYQRKENPSQCSLIEVSFAKSTYGKVQSTCHEIIQTSASSESNAEILNMAESDTVIFIKSELDTDAYESNETVSKNLKSYPEKSRCGGASSFTYKSKDATNKLFNNMPHRVGSAQDQVTANEPLPVCADGRTQANDCPIPVLLSKSFFSYVENLSGGGPDDLELGRNVLPPDWMDESSPETRQERSSCYYVNEMLMNIYRCIVNARVMSNDAYRDTMLLECLQCIHLAMNIHSNV